MICLKEECHEGAGTLVLYLLGTECTASTKWSEMGRSCGDKGGDGESPSESRECWWPGCHSGHNWLLSMRCSWSALRDVGTVVQQAGHCAVQLLQQHLGGGHIFKGDGPSATSQAVILTLQCQTWHHKPEDLCQSTMS